MRLRPFKLLACAVPVVFVSVHALWLDRQSRDRGTQRIAATTVLYGDPCVRPGDLVFRRGRSLNGRAVLLADGESRYSHVGLVASPAIAGPSGAGLSGASSRVMVIHAVPPTAGEAGGVVVDPIERFLSAGLASEWAVYRLRESFEGQASARAAAAAASMADRCLPFDADFDLADDREIYCTELVWRAYRQAGLDLVDGRYDEFRWPLRGIRPVILPSRLEKSPYLQRLFIKQIGEESQ